MQEKLFELENIFRKFPGIGPRQARRFAYFILEQPKSFAENISRLIKESRDKVRRCGSCQRSFFSENAKFSDCEVCLDKHRDSSILMITPKDADFEVIEKSRIFKGYYFILGGTVPILDKDPHSKIRSKELIEIVEKKINNGLKEIIISTNSTPEGEHTEDIVRNLLKQIGQKNNLKISTLGRGISTGTELEYLDSETIKNALKNRN